MRPHQATWGPAVVTSVSSGQSRPDEDTEQSLIQHKRPEGTGGPGSVGHEEASGLTLAGLSTMHGAEATGR